MRRMAYLKSAWKIIRGVLWAGAVLLLAGAVPAIAHPAVTSITVVVDDNYPPYIFRDEHGNLQGILPDEWALWEKETGVPVKLFGMDWGAALEFMRDGKADVIDTIFLNDERARLYEFTKPYAQIEVPVFFHKDLGGIGDVQSLRGFTIGVKEGDACIAVLRSHGITDFKEYPSYEAIIKAAMERQIRVFSVDKPPALYYLYKFNAADDFRYSFILYTGEFHRAVQKGRRQLLSLVEDGFSGITTGERRQVERKWLGTSFIKPAQLRVMGGFLFVVSCGALIMLALNFWLRRQVQRRTQELHANEDRLRSLLKAAPVGMALTQQRVLQQVNEALCYLTGYSPPELLGQDSRLLYSDATEYERVGLELYSGVARTGRGSVEAHWVRKNGSLIHVLLNSAPIDPRDPATGFALTALDITERKQAEENRLQLERKMQQAQKLESLGVLAGGIAHDFNNLLTAILGNLNLAVDELPPHAPVLDELHAAEAATRRAADLAKQMLAYSGKGRFDVRLLNLRQIIEEMTHMLQVAISKKVLLRFHFADNLPAIQADTTQIRQVIMNLVLNASEAIGERSGVIAVATGAARCTRAELATLLVQEVLPEGLYVFIEVADTGCGIAPEALPRIFDPFYSTKFTGRGLGLSAVQGIMRAHKGAIKIDSQAGKGTTFRMLFPAAEQPLPASATASGAGTWRGEGLVLLVDDEESVRATGGRMLERLGFEVITAMHGQEAIPLAQSHIERLACIVMDLTMPHMDGDETSSALRKQFPRIPIVLSSGYSEQDLADRFADRGFAGFIQKPYTLDILRATMEKACHHKKA